MGHKAHPIGLRLGIHRKWKSNWFFESKNYPKFIHLNLNIEKFFKGFLYFYGIKTLLLNCQLIKMPSNRIFIFVFHYRFRKKLKKKSYSKKAKQWKITWEKHFIKHNEKIYENKFLQNKSNFLELKNIIEIFQKNFNIKKFIFFENSFNINKNLLYKLWNQIKYLNKFIRLISKLKQSYANNVLFTKNLKCFLYHYSTKILIFKTYLKTILITKTKLNYYKKFFIKISLKYLYLIKNFKYIKTKLYLSNLNKNSFVKLKIFKYAFKTIQICKGIIFFYKKKFLKNYNKSKKISKKSKIFLLSKKNTFFSITKAKQFLSQITNSKINLIFINTLSFAKFFYLIEDSKTNNKEKYNVLQIQKIMLNKYKYNAIFIKDFVHLSFISILLKNTSCLVRFIGEQFKRLPKNRKQIKLLNFIQQTLKIFCQQRKEFSGFKLQIQGRLNRRNRTHKWSFQKGNLPIQTYKTRVEYGYSEGWTRSGLIGIKLWFFYQRYFKKILKKKVLQYLYYSKYKQYTNTNFSKLSGSPILKSIFFDNYSTQIRLSNEIKNFILKINASKSEENFTKNTANYFENLTLVPATHSDLTTQSIPPIQPTHVKTKPTKISKK